MNHFEMLSGVPSLPEVLLQAPLSQDCFAAATPMVLEVLKRYQVVTYGDLCAISEEQVRQVKGAGINRWRAFREACLELAFETEDAPQGGAVAVPRAPLAVRGVQIPEALRQVPLPERSIACATPKILEMLERYQVKTYGDLFAVTEEQVHLMRGVGFKGWRAFCEGCLKIAAASGGTEGSSKLLQFAWRRCTREEALSHILDVCIKVKEETREREVAVFRTRIAAWDATQTLEELGDRFAVTRERIRQREEKMKKALMPFLRSECEDLLTPVLALFEEHPEGLFTEEALAEALREDLPWVTAGDVPMLMGFLKLLKAPLHRLLWDRQAYYFSDQLPVAHAEHWETLYTVARETKGKHGGAFPQAFVRYEVEDLRLFAALIVFLKDLTEAQQKTRRIRLQALANGEFSSTHFSAIRQIFREATGSLTPREAIERAKALHPELSTGLSEEAAEDAWWAAWRSWDGSDKPLIVDWVKGKEYRYRARERMASCKVSPETMQHWVDLLKLQMDAHGLTNIGTWCVYEALKGTPECPENGWLFYSLIQFQAADELDTPDLCRVALKGRAETHFRAYVANYLHRVFPDGETQPISEEAMEEVFYHHLGYKASIYGTTMRAFGFRHVAHKGFFLEPLGETPMDAQSEAPTPKVESEKMVEAQAETSAPAEEVKASTPEERGATRRSLWGRLWASLTGGK